MSSAIADKHLVGVDLHLNRSVILRIDERGQQWDALRGRRAAVDAKAA